MLEPLDALAQAHELLTRGILQFLPQTAMSRDGAPEWQARVAASLGDILDREAQLASELRAEASHRALVLPRTSFPLAYSRHHFLPMTRALFVAVAEGTREAERIQAARQSAVKDPALASLLSKVLSARREHLRKLERLLRDAPAT